MQPELVARVQPGQGLHGRSGQEREGGAGVRKTCSHLGVSHAAAARRQLKLLSSEDLRSWVPMTGAHMAGNPLGASGAAK